MNDQKNNKKSSSGPVKSVSDDLSDPDALYLASSEALADWNRPEEDEAWKDL